MNAYEYIFAYETKEGHKGIVRADDKEEAIDKVNDYRSKDKVKYIVNLADIDNDYGIIEGNTIDKAIKNETSL